jgi:hypothetical protein
MACQTISEIRQFNEDARQALNELKGHRAAAPTSTKQNTDRATLKQDLELAEERVAKGKKLVARQREIVDELERDSHALAANARGRLAQFEELQAAYIVDRDWVKELSELR